MKKFKFTMQTLLNVKLTIEKQLMGEMAECNAKINSLEAVKQEILSRRAEQNIRYNQIISDGMPQPHAALWRGAFEAMRAKIETQDAAIIEAKKELAKVQAELLAIMKERKMLEILRDKQLEEYKLLQKAEDATAVDEFLSHKVYEGGN